MGELSVLLVHHDNLHEIEREAKLGKKVNDAIVSYSRRDRSHPVSSGVDIIHGNIHASELAVIVVEGNTAFHVGESLWEKEGLPDWSKAETHLVDLVRRLGYKVTRPRKKKK